MTNQQSKPRSFYKTGCQYVIARKRNGWSVPVEIVEERHKVKTELDKAFLLVTGQSTEDLCCVVHVVLGDDPAKRIGSDANDES